MAQQPISSRRGLAPNPVCTALWVWSRPWPHFAATDAVLQICSTPGPPSNHTNADHKIDTSSKKPRLTCANSGGGAPDARVELRGFEPLTP
jgi:hypothetical protein